MFYCVKLRSEAGPSEDSAICKHVQVSLWELVTKRGDNLKQPFAQQRWFTTSNYQPGWRLIYQPDEIEVPFRQGVRVIAVLGRLRTH
jgi:hypothetical protein